MLGTGDLRCIKFSGLRVERAVAGEVLRAIRGNAVQLELEQARYEAKLAARRYEAVDPGQRRAAELEARWNAALQKAQELEDRLRAFDDSGTLPATPDKEILLILAQDLPASPKQMIVRIMLRGTSLRAAGESARHGQHGQATEADAIEVIRPMSGRFGDGEIAATLSRLSLRTGAGNSWHAQRV